MKYITDVYALNIRCSQETCGDWHCSSLDWSIPRTKESEDSIFKDYGIEMHYIPEHGGLFPVATHIRAILDWFEAGKWRNTVDFYDDFICSEKYDDEICEKVYCLKDSPYWLDINRVMTKEMPTVWPNYLNTQNNRSNTET